jgi:hypothetical protein
VGRQAILQNLRHAKTGSHVLHPVHIWEEEDAREGPKGRQDEEDSTSNTWKGLNKEEREERALAWMANLKGRL